MAMSTHQDGRQAHLRDVVSALRSSALHELRPTAKTPEESAPEDFGNRLY